MGLISWAKETWNNDRLAKVLKATTLYSFKTVAHLFEQLGVLPQVFYSFTTHKRSNEIARQVTYIAVHDLLPMLLINAANDAIQRACAPTEQQDEENWPNGAYFISLSLALLQAGVKTYNFRQGVQMTTRTLLVSLSAPDAFNQVAPRPPSPYCREENCTFTKQLASGGVELVGLMANDMAVWSLGKISWIEPLSKIVSMYVRGRYILKSTTPERCPAHRGIASENALALGLGHELILISLKRFLSSTLGLPPSICIDAMDKMVLVFQMAVARHLNPPLVKPGEGILAFDPLETYENFVGWLTEVFVSGVIKHPPTDLFSGPGNVPWGKIKDKLWQLNQHAVVGHFKLVFLPPLMRSDKAFVRDPVISQLWSPLQKQISDTLGSVISIGRNKAIIGIASYTPKTPIKIFLKFTFGVPQKLTHMVVNLVSDPETCDLMESLRNWILHLNPEADVKLVTPKTTRPALRQIHPAKGVGKEEDTKPLPLKAISTEDMLQERDPVVVISPEAILPRFFDPKRNALSTTASASAESPSIEDLLGF